ncbi:hypothetical protein NX722_09050 [Endozoicomonas gorgoniicola]|uniref:Transposase n=1 Tax=Endozoicomonas gorgoniicola TaxID=1234144 RepID=A0ABT3MTR9_9GAMM|nr:hypothetical protein [Endozoicomonas gorgoniicola]MCW7552787.1 hypothetical protein [Endozoicomonas gorgoniicola]
MTTHRPTDFWKHHIRAWKKSGLSQSEYARRHELPVKTFGYHKRRLDNQRIIQSALDSKEPKSLIPVSVAQEPEPQKTQETGITLVSPSGLRVELASGFDATALKQVLNLLEVA